MGHVPFTNESMGNAKQKCCRCGYQQFSVPVPQQWNNVSQKQNSHLSVNQKHICAYLIMESHVFLDFTAYSMIFCLLHSCLLYSYYLFIICASFYLFHIKLYFFQHFYFCFFSCFVCFRKKLFQIHFLFLNLH